MTLPKELGWWREVLGCAFLILLLFLAAILSLGILAMCGCACHPRGPVYMPPEARKVCE